MWLDIIYTSLDEKLFYIFLAVSGLIIILNVIQFIMAFIDSSQFRSGSSIELFICIGGWLLAASVLMRGVGSEYEIDEKLLCELFPSVLCVGLSEFIGGLLVKSWTLFLFEYILINRKAKNEEWKANFWMLILSFICAIFIIIWCVKYTPFVVATPLLNDTTMQCSSDHWYKWKLVTSIYHAFLLLCALIAAFVCFKVGTAYAIMTSLSIINASICAVCCVVVHYAYTSATPSLHYAITGGLMLWAVLFNSISSIISKCCNSRNHSRPRRDSIEVPIGGETYDTINSDKIKTTDTNINW